MGKYCYICKEHFKADIYHNGCALDIVISPKRFPKNEDTRKIWLDAFGFEEDDIFGQTTVCSKHFEDNCYHVPNELTGNKLLKKDSIPTLFLQRTKALSNKNQTKRKLEITEESLNTEIESLTPSDEFSTDNAIASYEFLLDTADIELEEPIRKKQKRWRPAHVSQVDVEHGFDKPDKAKINFNLAITKVNTLKNKIINLNRRNRALKSKVKSLETCIHHLKVNNLISKDAHSTIQKLISPIIRHLHNCTNEEDIE